MKNSPPTYLPHALLPTCLPTYLPCQAGSRRGRHLSFGMMPWSSSSSSSSRTVIVRCLRSQNFAFALLCFSSFRFMQSGGETLRPSCCCCSIPPRSGDYFGGCFFFGPFKTRFERWWDQLCEMDTRGEKSCVLKLGYQPMTTVDWGGGGAAAAALLLLQQTFWTPSREYREASAVAGVGREKGRMYHTWGKAAVAEDEEKRSRTTWGTWKGEHEEAGGGWIINIGIMKDGIYERWEMENRQCWCTIFLGTRRAWYWVCRVCWRI